VRRLFLLFFFALSAGGPFRTGATERGTTLVVATYNVCNLFDTINDPGIADEVPTPEAWRRKTERLGRTIGAMAPDVIALCEVENAGVLDALLGSPGLAGEGYRHIHYDSPDRRGIDVALLYRADRMRLTGAEPIRMATDYPTRDVLRAEFSVEGATRPLVVYAVHLPSRRGGYHRATRAREEMAARLDAHAAADSAAATVVLLGDFNENPSSRLVRRRLEGWRPLAAGAHGRGEGSYAWHDVWLMFDQIFVGRGTVAEEARVFLRQGMLTRTGRFEGYPDRELSDHLPVYTRILLR